MRKGGGGGRQGTPLLGPPPSIPRTQPTPHPPAHANGCLLLTGMLLHNNSEEGTVLVLQGMHI